VAEQRTFVFAVTFIILFSAFIVTIPADLQGSGSSGVELTAIDPALVTDFADSESFQKSDFVANIYWYPAVLGGYYFACSFSTDSFYVSAKSLFFGVWLGAMSPCDWTNKEGLKTAGALSFTDITNDSEDGIARYTLNFHTDGSYAGVFLFYWNTTTYSSPSDAWTADGLYMVHGVGITPNTDVVSLLVSLLFLQLPDCPVLINALLATPLWACVIFLIWFVIKESLPFV